MTIHVRYFASLKEAVGRSEQHISIENIITVKDVWLKSNPDQDLPDNILAAINMDYAELNTAVTDGDEVAFFPPVTGG